MKSMKRWKIFTVLFIMLLIFSSKSYASEDRINIRYNNQTVQARKVPIMLDGKLLESEVPSYIETGRTIVPVRLISEALGADVTWNQALRMATVNRGNKRLDLFINQNQVKVNGLASSLDTSSIPRLVQFDNSGNSHTMLPLAFIGEQLGVEVGYNNETRIPFINSQEEASKPEKEINKVGYPRMEEDQIVIPSGNMKYKKFKLSNPNRIVVDILDSKLDGMEKLDKEKSLSYIKGIRAANYNDPKVYGTDTSVVRYVFDIDENYGHKDLQVITQGRDLIIKPDKIVEKPEIEVPVVPVKPSNPGQKTIFIDAGHGGRDPGAVAKDKTREKDLTLTMALKTERALKAQGYNVIMTRRDDRYVPYQDVPGIANRAGADFFVSYHVNSAGNITQANGIETFYCPAYDGPNKQGNQYPFASAIHNEVIRATGATDRGIKKGRFNVIRHTKMPAVLLEIGFLSNAEELAKMKTGAYQDAIVAAVVRGINKSCQ